VCVWFAVAGQGILGLGRKLSFQAPFVMGHSPAHKSGSSMNVVCCDGVTSHSVVRPASTSDQAFTKLLWVQAHQPRSISDLLPACMYGITGC